MEIPVRTPKHHDLIYDVGLHKGEDAEFYFVEKESIIRNV